MVGNKKCFSIVVLIAMLSSVSSFFAYPSVTRTSDAIIIDFAPLSQTYPRNFGVPFFNPYVMVQPANFYKGWPLLYGYPDIVTPGSFYRRTEEGKKRHVGKQNLRQRQATTTTTTTTAAPTTTTTAATTTTTTATTTTATTTTAAPAAQCGKGATATPTETPAASRSLISERVAGGSEAKTKTWTFLVYLYDTGITPPSLVNFFCSGTLLSPTKVLTAASCFEKMSLFQMSQVTIKVGGYWGTGNDAQSTRRVSQIVINSQYNSFTYANDIAIITMDMPVVFSKTVGPVCLPPASQDPDAYAGTDAVVIGWGQASVVASTTAINLQQALVAVGYNQDCKSDTAISKYMTNTTSCITSTSGSVYTCASDVGGPVLVNSAPNVQGTNAIWTQVAINSFTAADCASNGLKTNVAAFIPWINTYNV